MGAGHSPKTKGVWRSTNGGQNWEFQGDAMSLTDRNVSALTISVNGNADQILFAATETGQDAHLYKSTDLGVSWTLTNNLPYGVTQIRSIDVGFTCAEILLSTDKGFFMSTDRGQTWNEHNDGLPLAAYNTYVAKCGFGSEHYIGTGISTFKYAWDGSGFVWAPISTGSSLLNTASITVNNGTTFGVSSSWNGIAQYSSGSWDVTNSTMGFLGRSVSIHPPDPSNVFVGGSLNGKGIIYRSTDGGTTWSFSKALMQANTYFSTIVNDPTANSQNVFAGIAGSGVGSVNFYRSMSLGAFKIPEEWIGTLISGISGTPVNAIALDKSTSTIYVGVGLGRGLYTSDGSNFPLAGLYGHNINTIALNSSTSTLANTVYAGGDTRIWKTTNKFSTVSTLYTPFNGAKKILMHPTYPSDANHVLVITADGQKLYRTSNGGTSWTEINTSSIPKPLNDIQTDPSSNVYFYVATSSGVYKVDDAPDAVAGFSNTTSNNHPSLSWNSNTEPDFASYKVYRYYEDFVWWINKWVGQGTYGLSVINTITNINTTSYIDYSETQYNMLPCSQGGTMKKASYYVKAVDNGTSESPTSPLASYTIDCVDGGNEYKLAFASANPILIPDAYALE